MPSCRGLSLRFLLSSRFFPFSCGILWPVHIIYRANNEIIVQNVPTHPKRKYRLPVEVCPWNRDARIFLDELGDGIATVFTIGFPSLLNAPSSFSVLNKILSDLTVLNNLKFFSWFGTEMVSQKKNENNFRSRVIHIHNKVEYLIIK